MTSTEERPQTAIIVNLTTRDTEDLISLVTGSESNNILKLDNKYYTAFVQCLIFRPGEHSDKDFSDCHAIVIFVDYDDQIKERLSSCLQQLSAVKGEPRIVVHFGDKSEDEPHADLIEQWSTDNGFEPILVSSDLSDKEEAHKKLIDSLSAYRWPYITMKSKEKLSDETMQKLEDFDDLLNQINMYRERVATNAVTHDDDMLMKIAERITSIMGEDYEPEEHE